MKQEISIAIDGPAASGKTTLSKSLADALGFLYFDTGVMYRAVTLAVLEKSVDISDEETITQIANDSNIDVLPVSQDDGRLYDVILNGDDSTWKIRTPEVDRNVSTVAAYPGVRAALMKQQRKIGLRGGVVMAGRDIGTVILPDAQLKIYLDATVEERALRRYNELNARGEQRELKEVEEAMRKRDEIDENREIAPLRRADDAVILHSDGRLPLEVLNEALSLAKEKMAKFD